VNVQNCVAFRVDERCHFERLNPVIRSTTVVFARVFAVEKRRVYGSVAAWLVQLRREVQQYSPVLILSHHLTSVE